MDKEFLSKWIHSPRDYWKIGPVYVWKWLFLALLGIAAVGVLTVFGLPFRLRSETPEIPAYRYNDPELREVTGVVRILDGRDRVRYEGEVAAGSCTGRGKVYNEEGQLVYEGPVADGVYEGEGAKVYSDGLLIYEGTMAANLYEGEGRRIDPDTGIVSEGMFAAGVFEGEGRQYDANGVLLREGTFQDGLLHGTGVQYTPGGVLEYEGEFQAGLFHGQGKLYDTADQALFYEGEFVWGEPTGQGRIYHPSGQLLYEGQVCDGQPRADAFLGLSLAEVEAAFQEHWVLYSCEDTTAFVYPYFHLMFITEVPVHLTSPSQQEAKTGKERQELLEAIGAQAQQYTAAEETAAQESATDEPWAAEPIGDMELSQDTVKSDVLISEVLSYGAPLSGVAQPDSSPAAGTRKMGWREWFSDFATGETMVGASALQTGPFIYEFTALTPVLPPDTDYYLAGSGGVESTTVLRDWKDSPIWYQSAVRRDEGT